MTSLLTKDDLHKIRLANRPKKKGIKIDFFKTGKGRLTGPRDPTLTALSIMEELANTRLYTDKVNDNRQRRLR